MTNSEAYAAQREHVREMLGYAVPIDDDEQWLETRALELAAKLASANSEGAWDSEAVIDTDEYPELSMAPSLR